MRSPAPHAHDARAIPLAHDARAIPLAHDARAIPPALEASGLVRRFANGRGILGADLAVSSGELVALVGESGGGKTTLLRLLAGLDTPDEGTVAIGGAERRGLARRDTRVAVVFQRPRLVGRLDALANVLAGRLGHLPRWRGIANCWRDVDLRTALEALDQVGLLDRAADRVDRLSGGEQQRVSIARALAQGPSILLADEPVSSLDPDNARKIVALLAGCAERGLAVIASLHQPELAHAYARRVLRMKGGRLAPLIAR